MCKSQITKADTMTTGIDNQESLKKHKKQWEQEKYLCSDDYVDIS